MPLSVKSALRRWFQGYASNTDIQMLLDWFGDIYIDDEVMS